MDIDKWWETLISNTANWTVDLLVICCSNQYTYPNRTAQSFRKMILCGEIDEIKSIIHKLSHGDVS